MQQLVDSHIVVGQHIGHRDAAVHGPGRAIGVRTHQPLQRQFGEVGTGEAIAGRNKIEDVGQRELA